MANEPQKITATVTSGKVIRDVSFGWQPWKRQQPGSNPVFPAARDHLPRMLATDGVVVGDDVHAANTGLCELLAVAAAPLARAAAFRVGCRRQVDVPQGLNVFLALDDKHPGDQPKKR